LYKEVIEPSAGDGAFSDFIPNCISMDICPKKDYIRKQDFLSYEHKTSVDNKDILIVGNPPFGKQASMAIKFIKKGCSLANTIAFILPRSFEKESMKNKIPKNFHLIINYELQDNIFLLDDKEQNVSCVFQVWKKLSFEREERKCPPCGFFYVKKDDNPDFAIRRVGVYAGKIFFDKKEIKDPEALIKKLEGEKARMESDLPDYENDVKTLVKDADEAEAKYYNSKKQKPAKKAD
jgi:hypothetical protein